MQGNRIGISLSYEGTDENGQVMLFGVHPIGVGIYASNYQNGELSIFHPWDENEVKFVDFMYRVFEPKSVDRVSNLLSEAFMSSQTQKLQKVIFHFKGESIVATKDSSYGDIIKQVIHVNERNGKRHTF